MKVTITVDHSLPPDVHKAASWSWGMDDKDSWIAQSVSQDTCMFLLQAFLDGQLNTIKFETM